MNGKAAAPSAGSAAGGTLNLSKANLARGVYLLSVKGVNGNSFAARITHTGGGALNINVAFSGAANSQTLSKSAADGPDYGEWMITVSAEGYITQTRKIVPTAGTNPQQSFELVAVTQTAKSSFTETVNGVSFNMVYIPGGSFTLGCDAAYRAAAGISGNCPANTGAVQAAVSNYFIGATTVTRELWQAVMGSVPGPSYGLMFTWYDAITFACQLSQLTGRNYRMQTEAEFEYAAKNHLSSLTLGSSEEWAYNTWSASHSGGTDPTGTSGPTHTHTQKTRRNAQGTGDNVTGRLIRSIEGIGPQLRLTLSADTDIPPNYLHPCRISAPAVGEEPVNSYRDPRWVTGSDAMWRGGGTGSGTNIMIWEDGTAATISNWSGRETVTPGQWFTSNNITLVFVPSSGSSSVTRYAYIFLSETDASYISTTGMSGRLVKGAASGITKPTVSNLRRGEDLARARDDFETEYKMVNMADIPQSARKQDPRLLDGPDHGWLQINTGATHHYRKDVDPDEFRFIVSGANLAHGEWFTVNNTFLRVTNRGFNDTCAVRCTGGSGNFCSGGTWSYVCEENPNDPFVYVAEYLYVVTSGSSPSFYHNSFMGYERGDMRVFTKLENSSSRISAIANQCSRCVGEIPKGQNVASMYRNDEETGHSTFVPAPCPAGGCR